MRIRVFIYMEKLKKIASYIWDVPIANYSSPYNPHLQVVWSGGKKMLHSKNANYSYGSLHEVFSEACIRISKEISEAKSILVLGFGAGSILHILEKNYNYQNKVVGLDYDPIIFEIYQKHFAPEIKLQAELVISDAKKFLLTTNEKFDIIFIDLFQDLQTDSLLFSPELPNLLRTHLENNGTIVINTIIQNSEDKNAAFELLINFGKTFKKVSTQDCHDLNRIIFAK